VTNIATDTAKITQVDDVKGVADFFRGFLNAKNKAQTNGQ
jgi:hypothetical protein